MREKAFVRTPAGRMVVRVLVRVKHHDGAFGTVAHVEFPKGFREQFHDDWEPGRPHRTVFVEALEACTVEMTGL